MTFEELKKCKTINEIYCALGDVWFEKINLVLLTVLCLLPMIGAMGYLGFYLSGNEGVSGYFKMQEFYTAVMELMGIGILVFATLHCLFRNSGHSIKDILKTKIKLWMIFLIILLLLGFIATVLSEDFSLAFAGNFFRFDGYESLILYVGVLLCAYQLRNIQYRKYIIILYSVIANFLSVIMLFQTYKVEPFSLIYPFEGASVFYNPNHFAYFLNMSIIGIAGLYVYSDKNEKIFNVYLMMSYFVQVYTLIVNNTFGCFLAMMLTLLILPVFYWMKNRRINKKFFILIGSVILITYLNYAEILPSGTESNVITNIEETADDTLKILQNEEDVAMGSGRIGLWKQTIVMIKEKPLFGYGADMNPLMELGDTMMDRPHNEYLQYALFYGVPAGICYIGMLVALFMIQWGNLRVLKEEVIIAAGIVCTYAISAFFGNTMFYTTPFFYMFLGFAAIDKEVTNEE